MPEFLPSLRNQTYHLFLREPDAQEPTPEEAAAVEQLKKSSLLPLSPMHVFTFNKGLTCIHQIVIYYTLCLDHLAAVRQIRKMMDVGLKWIPPECIAFPDRFICEFGGFDINTEVERILQLVTSGQINHPIGNFIASSMGQVSIDKFLKHPIAVLRVCHPEYDRHLTIFEKGQV